MNTLKDEVERIRTQPVSAVIPDLDSDTSPAEIELARLGLLRAYCEFLPIALVGAQVPRTPNHRRLQPFGCQQSEHLTWLPKPVRDAELLTAIRKAQESGLPRQANGA